MITDPAIFSYLLELIGQKDERRNTKGQPTGKGRSARNKNRQNRPDQHLPLVDLMDTLSNHRLDGSLNRWDICHAIDHDLGLRFCQGVRLL